MLVFFRSNQPTFSPIKSQFFIPQNPNEDSDDEDEHHLNIDESKEQNSTLFENDEQSSDDEQVRILSTEVALSQSHNSIHLSIDNNKSMLIYQTMTSY